MTEAPIAPEALSLQGLLAQIDREATRDLVDSLPEETVREIAKPTIKHVVFALNDSHYAVPMANVLELQRLPNITALPNVPDWLRGVTNMRGDVLSVVDLRSLLGLPDAAGSVSQRLVVVRSTREEIATGWVVDRVIGIRGIALEDLKPCSTLMTGTAASFLSGIVDQDAQLIAVLDVNRVLSSPEMRRFEPTWHEA